MIALKSLNNDKIQFPVINVLYVILSFRLMTLNFQITKG